MSPRDPAIPARARGRSSRRRGADIHAVARRAGVSISTVSRCLSGKRKFAPEIERRIVDAARALAYSPNRIARSLRTRRTLALGMIIPDNSNPYFSDVVQGAEDAARAAGFVLLLFGSGEDREREREHFVTMKSFRCDGALLVPAPEGGNEGRRRRLLHELDLPIVCLGRDPGWGTDVVLADNFAASHEAVRHLVGLGHRRVGIVTVDERISSQQQRLLGYRAALEEAGLRAQASYEARVRLTVGDGLAAAKGLLSLPLPPTALFATSNSLSVGAVSAVEALGLRCPRDVSVVGYDDYAWQDVFHPRLTTVAQPAYEIGRRAAELLLDRLAGRKTGPSERVMLKARLVVRESAGELGRGP